MSALSFSKYHGLGNDFIVVDLRDGEPSPSPQTASAARALCDRRFGVGADGVLAILPPQIAGADCRMRVLNADGSEAEMCGNGVRCVARHLHERDPGLRRPRLHIETLAGVMVCDIERGAGGDLRVAVDMGRPRLTRAEIPMAGAGDERCLEQSLDVGGTSLRMTAVSMGNPHAVLFVDETGPGLRALAERLGAGVESHPWFPRRANAGFARVETPDRIELVVWERGCGITLACGTGACAAAVAACLGGRSRAGHELSVRLLGGELGVTVEPDYSRVIMRGPATLVFEGTTDLAL